MRFLRIFLGTLLLAVNFGAFAQLASLKPLSMQKLDVANNGDSRFADIEIVFSDPLEGVKVVKDNNARPAANRTNTPTTVYAQVLDIQGHTGKALTITHPDFVPCYIEFDKIGLTEPVKAGNSYKITVEVPGLDYVNANKAFANLDFDKASTLYNKYLTDENAPYATSAKSRLEQMESLANLVDFVKQNQSSSDLTTRRKLYVVAKDLYKKTGARKAYELFTKLEKELIPNKVADEETGVSRMTINKVWHDPQKDISAMSETRLPKENGEHMYAQLMVEVGLDNVTFEGIEQFMDAERKNGIYYVFVPKGSQSAETFYVCHPDFEPFPVALKDYSFDEVKGGRDYHISIAVPPRTIMEADRAFGALDFNSAMLLYSDILLNADLYDENILQGAAENLNNISSLVDENYAGTWNRIRGELNKIGSASREVLAAKTDSLIQIASTLKERGVPGMAYNVKRYQQRKDEYLHSVYLDLSARAINENREVIIANGKEKPVEMKSLWLEYKIPGEKQTFRQHVYSSKPGDFNTYVPRQVSAWLVAHPGKSIQIIPQKKVVHNGIQTYQNYKLRAGNKDKLNVSLDSGDRSITADIYMQEK